jgi:LacI family transcriptional regulator
MRLKKKNTITDVAVALRLSFSSHRDILAGISNYAKTHHWRLQFIVPHDVEAHENIEIRQAADADGIISCEDPETIAKMLSPASRIPIVTIHSHLPPPRNPAHPVGIIRMNGNGIGALGAEHLLSCGRFRTFAFVSENHRDPKHDSVLQGFRKHLAKNGFAVNVYPRQNSVAGSEEDMDALAAWLKSLPKPAAVMATYDLRATQVLDAACHAGISVPDQMSIIGSDNDELLCDFTTPTLTSIAPNFTKAGATAALTLDRMMRRRSSRIPEPVIATVNDKRIVIRESTAHTSPSARLVEQALSFINKNALSGINAADVVKHLGVSRRLADMRFREATNSSILEMIIALRLKEVERLLAETSMPISTITDRCGFRNENHAKNLFKKHRGLSMRAWRVRNRIQRSG